MTSTSKCEFCDKRGLPILLVRDAVAPSKSGAPLAPGPSIELAPSAAHYTKRLLRSGYVNVFDEARRRWETYFVTSDGYLFKLLQTPGMTPVVPRKPFNCPDEGHRAAASCITVSDPANASKVWIGFSDVLWTDAVRKANEDAAYRKRHMAEIDVKAVLKGNSTPHQPVSQLDAAVAEYAMTSSQAKATLSWSPFAFASRHGYGERVKQECESLRPGIGLIVTLPDPVAVVQELAILMLRNSKMFLERNPENGQKLAASCAIDQIEEAVRKQGEHMEIAAAEQIADRHVEANPIGHWLSEPTRARTEKMLKVTRLDLKRTSDEAWKKYAEKFNCKDRKLWHESFRKRFEAFDADFIAPLALNHVAWMKSTSLADHFECNYDPHHAESGLVYTNVLTHCVIATQDKQACAELYDEWLKGKVTDPKNLLLQAMVLNQKITATAVDSATTVSIDLRQIPWDNIFAVSTSALARLSERAQEATARLIVQIAGPVARMFNKVMDGSAGFRAAVMATGLISGHPIIVCDIVGTKAQFRKYLIRQLLQASGNVVSKRQMERAVLAEMKRQNIHGSTLEGTTRRRFVMAADKEMIARMPRGLTQQQTADCLARSIVTMEAVDELNLNRWRTVINSDVRLGVVAGILQAVTLGKLMADQENSLQDEKSDATKRFYVGLCTVFATTAEVIGNALGNRALQGLPFGQGIASAAASTLKYVGKTGGFLTGLFSAGLDVMKAAEVANEKQAGLAWLYIGSATASAGLSAAMLGASLLGAAAIPIIGILVIALIGISLLIEYNKDNAVQDWLERCPWGILVQQRYPDLLTQQAQLMKAIGEG